MRARFFALLVLSLLFACDKGSSGSRSPELVSVGPEPTAIPGEGASGDSGGGGGEADGEAAEKVEIDLQITTEGAMTPADVAAALDAQMANIHACYQEAIERTYNEDLAGVVVVNFVVGANGKVNGAAVTEQSLGDSVAVECIVGVVAGSQLPRPGDGKPVRVRYPVKLGK